MFVSETATSRIALDDGIVVVRIRAGVAQRIADARQNLAGAVVACGGERRPVMVDIQRAEPLTAEVRHFYMGEILTDSFVALAMLVEGTAFGRAMGNVYLRIAQPQIPAQLFANEEEARRWLKSHLR